MTARTSVLTHRKLLGVLSDSEIARRAGVSPTTVGKVRAELGIPVLVHGDLARTPPPEVLRRARARAKAGKAMRTVGSSVPGDGNLADLCRYHFRGWYEAVAAAGLKPAEANWGCHWLGCLVSALLTYESMQTINAIV